MPWNESAPWAGGQDGPDITQRQLLQSIVEVARSVFGAAAASVFLLDRADGKLVFEAVAGEGEDELVGTSFPSSAGIAGWVTMSGQPLLVDDVSQSPQFARASAEDTGYVPTSIMAAPLVQDGECVGVLEVLDRGTRPRGELGDVDLLGLLATELATAIQLLVHLRWLNGQSAPANGDPAPASLSLLHRVAERLPGASEPVASTVIRLLDMADQLLNGEEQAAGRAYV